MGLIYALLWVPALLILCALLGMLDGEDIHRPEPRLRRLKRRMRKSVDN
jgi:hypothetical protein